MTVYTDKQCPDCDMGMVDDYLHGSWMVPKPCTTCKGTGKVRRIKLFDFQEKVLAEYLSKHPVSIPSQTIGVFCCEN